MLDSLLSVIHELRERIEAYGDALRQSEALTRYALIDPLLRELGWNTEDPGLVIPEYRSGNGSADYALLGSGSPLMMVEAKKLDTPLRDVVGQGIQYCLMQGTAHFSVTDGRRWEIYETHRPVPIDEKRVVSFDLKALSPAEVSLQALALWRPGVHAGRVAAGQAPVLVLPVDDPSPPPPSPRDEWQPLSELSPQPGSGHPVEVRFPDNETALTTAWNAVLVETVRWLINSDYLNTSHCPIRVRSSGLYRVAASPVHPSGNDFRSGVRIESLYVEKHGGASQIVDSTRFIVEHVAQDPSQFKVRFSSRPPST